MALTQAELCIHEPAFVQVGAELAKLNTALWPGGFCWASLRSTPTCFFVPLKSDGGNIIYIPPSPLLAGTVYT